VILSNEEYWANRQQIFMDSDFGKETEAEFPYKIQFNDTNKCIRCFDIYKNEIPSQNRKMFHFGILYFKYWSDYQLALAVLASMEKMNVPKIN